jgi:hypothetical protein
VIGYWFATAGCIVPRSVEARFKPVPGGVEVTVDDARDLAARVRLRCVFDDQRAATLDAELRRALPDRASPVPMPAGTASPRALVEVGNLARGHDYEDGLRIAAAVLAALDRLVAELRSRGAEASPS